MRSLVRETRLSADRFVAPLFVRHGSNLREEISSLPGVFRLSPDQAVSEARDLQKLGVPAVILFGIPERKDDVGSEAWPSRPRSRRPSDGSRLRCRSSP
jgi:porphobilinogen synthase